MPWSFHPFRLRRSVTSKKTRGDLPRACFSPRSRLAEASYWAWHPVFSAPLHTMAGTLICGAAPSRRFWLCLRSWSLHRAQEGNRRGLDLFSGISGRSKKVRAFLGRESVEKRANRSASRPAVRFNAVPRRSQNFEKEKESKKKNTFP